MDAKTFWLALALVLVVEGAYPFLSPRGWRNAFARLLQFSDDQIRFFAALCISTGLLLICLLGG